MRKRLDLFDGCEDDDDVASEQDEIGRGRCRDFCVAFDDEDVNAKASPQIGLC